MQPKECNSVPDEQRGIMAAQQKEQFLRAAERHCLAYGFRLTPTRRQILALVLDYSDVVKAYDILNDLQRIRGNAAPPTVYRALEFLVDMGILHRAESLNGFVLCHQFEKQHVSIIINCSQCGKIVEIDAKKPVEKLLDFCHQYGFEMCREPIVLNGVCAECQQQKKEI